MKIAARRGFTRRQWIALTGLSAMLPTAGQSSIASAWTLRAVAVEGPVRRIHAGGPSGLLAIGDGGTAWALSLDGIAPRRLGEGLDPLTPIATGHGRIAARMADGSLWVWSDGRVSIARATALAIHAGLLSLPLAVVVVVVDRGTHRVARFEPGATGWSETARSSQAVMPDARPLQVAFDARSGDDEAGHLVVLGGPDTRRYDHGILGDAIEATRMLWLDRHRLQVLRELSLPDPYVFEDIAPRPVTLDRGSGLLTMRSGGAGTRLALVTADHSRPDALRIAALGEPLGGPHRWLAPTTDGAHWMAVHTPHVGGVLNAYRQDGDRLIGRVVATDVANHRIGTRELDLATWSGAWLVVPSQDGLRLRTFDGADGWRELAPVVLPARVVATVALSDSRGFAALIEGGTLLHVMRSS